MGAADTTDLAERGEAGFVTGPTPLEDIARGQDGTAVMNLLERGIPLTLLIDLLSPLGTASAATLADEQAESA